MECLSNKSEIQDSSKITFFSFDLFHLNIFNASKDKQGWGRTNYLVLGLRVENVCDAVLSFDQENQFGFLQNWDPISYVVSFLINQVGGVLKEA